ncbi:MAG: hypothetical protein AAFO01_21735 [Pseudomonadota bacterium]
MEVSASFLFLASIENSAFVHHRFELKLAVTLITWKIDGADLSVGLRQSFDILPVY